MIESRRMTEGEREEGMRFYFQLCSSVTCRPVVRINFRGDPNAIPHLPVMMRVKRGKDIETFPGAGFCRVFFWEGKEIDFLSLRVVEH